MKYALEELHGRTPLEKKYFHFSLGNSSVGTLRFGTIKEGDCCSTCQLPHTSRQRVFDS